MGDSFTSTMSRVRSVIGPATLGMVHLEPFIHDFIHRFEMGQPEFICFSETEGHLGLGWEDPDLTIVCDECGPLELEFIRGLDSGIATWLSEQLVAAESRRGNVMALSEDSVVERVVDDLERDCQSYTDPVSEFRGWGGLYDTVESMSVSMVQAQMAMEWVEGQRERGRSPEQLGFVVAVDGDTLLLGCDGGGVHVHADGKIDEIYRT